MNFEKELLSSVEKGELPKKTGAILDSFYRSYITTLKDHGFDVSPFTPLFLQFLSLIKEEIQTPFSFSPYHSAIRTPFDYYQFGVDFMRPLVNQELSSTQGDAHLQEIETNLKKGENAIFLANHQTEADPQAISILLEEKYPSLAEKMIFVAGERVLTDPLAIPFSKGRNLLCIYSKRYMDHPPEKKSEKLLHNQKAMQRLKEKLKEGGQAIYVAPSGGRDRMDATGSIAIAPFDPQSIDLFLIIAEASKTPTSFYPMTLATYDLLPPPETIQKELGEERKAKHGAIHMTIGKRLDMHTFPGSAGANKHLKRELRARYIWEIVASA